MNIELHENLMRVTVDTFKRETDKLKERVVYLEQNLRDLGAFCDSYQRDYGTANSALLRDGYELTTTGEWKPPLGKRPDFEGQSLIAAAMAFVEAQRKMFDAANKYEERTK